MIAYTEAYLGNARTVLGFAMEVGINVFGIDPDTFGKFFVLSGFGHRFSAGDPSVVMGMSGKDLASNIMEKIGFQNMKEIPERLDISPEYWAGWALAYYQWHNSREFETIFDRVPLSEIISMYEPYHEMDIGHFVEAMDRKFMERIPETNLMKRRRFYGISQSELASRSGVKLRAIQLYEQRQNSINKARADTVARLAHVLDCPMEALLEDPLSEKEYHVE